MRMRAFISLYLYFRTVPWHSILGPIYGNSCDGTLSFITIEAASLAGVFAGGLNNLYACCVSYSDFFVLVVCTL